MANEIGCIPFNQEIGISLVVRGQHECISNEIKKNGLIFERSDILQVRKGDVIVLYFTKNKETPI